MDTNNLEDHDTLSNHKMQVALDKPQDSITENIEQFDIVPSKLKDNAQQVHDQKTEVRETVRTILTWFGAKRRGVSVINLIQKALAEVGLKTEPDFTSAYIDAEVSLISVQQLSREIAEIEIPKNDTNLNLNIDFLSATWQTTPTELVTGAIADPTFRIGKLKSANKVPVTVTPNTTLKEATTIMMLQNFSQLPVMQNEREVKGVISWKSIGKSQSLGRPCQQVKDCMDIEVPEVPYNYSLLSAIDGIVKYGYVLVRKQDRTISGIVTNTDLSIQFRQLAEPFLLVGEIENYIRRLIGGKFTVGQLSSVRPSDNEREIITVADLTFGEYVRLLERSEYWETLKISVDRTTFVKSLERIRELRNEVMHFNPDPFEEDDLQRLRLFASFMRFLDVKQE